MIKKLNDLLNKYGLFVRGGFFPEPGDGIPLLSNGSPTRTVVLIGNAGSALWDSFTREVHNNGRHSLDHWLTPIITKAANKVDAEPIFPNQGPPFIPLAKWAMRAESVYRSPIGILIHSTFGLWHVYRAAFLFNDKVPVPNRSDDPNPCSSCVSQPCLRVCPADAFGSDRFNAYACSSFVESEWGENCRDRGCMARRACPIGRDYSYFPAQQKFHTAAMLEAVKKGFG